MIERLTDPSVCRSVTDKHPDYFTFDAEEWFSQENNYALKSGDNVAFAEYKSPGVYWVHFCFDTARGREAINLAQDILETFQQVRPVKICIGLIEVNNKKARWLIRQVGFKSLETVETKLGLCEMFYWVKEK